MQQLQNQHPGYRTQQLSFPPTVAYNPLYGWPQFGDSLGHQFQHPNNFNPTANGHGDPRLGPQAPSHYTPVKHESLKFISPPQTINENEEAVFHPQEADPPAHVRGHVEAKTHSRGARGHHDIEDVVARLKSTVSDLQIRNSRFHTENVDLERKVNANAHRVAELEAVVYSLGSRLRALEARRDYPVVGEAAARPASASATRGRPLEAPRRSASVGAVSRRTAAPTSDDAPVEAADEEEAHAELPQVEAVVPRAAVSRRTSAPPVRPSYAIFTPKLALPRKAPLSTPAPQRSTAALTAPAPRPSEASPRITLEARISLGDDVLMSVPIAQTLSQDGPFYYVAQAELEPPCVLALPEGGEGEEAEALLGQALHGVCVSILASSGRGKKASTSLIFKSHASHVAAPPVNAPDGYFSHSCWLSGGGASVVGGVRVFFRPDGQGRSLAIHGLSLKYWFPNPEATPFTAKDWRALLKLLGLL